MNNSSNSWRRISFGLESKRFGLVSASGVGPCRAFFLFEFICGHLQPILAWFTRGNIIVTLWNLLLHLRKVSFLEIIYWIRDQEFEWQPSEEVSCGIPARRDRGRDGELQASLASKPEPCQKQTDEPWNKNPTAPNKQSDKIAHLCVSISAG